MSRFFTFFTPLALLLAIAVFSATPVLRDLYTDWQESNDRKWRAEWEKGKKHREDKATEAYSKTRTFSNTQYGDGGQIDIRIQYKAVDFEEVAFIVSLSPIDDEMFEKFVEGRIRGETVIYLNLRDSDGFRLEEIGFSNPRRQRAKDADPNAMVFETTRQLEFSILDRVQSFDVSSRASYE